MFVEWRAVVGTLLEWIHVGRIVEVQLPVVFIQPVEIAFNAFVPMAQFAVETEGMIYSKIGT